MNTELATKPDGTHSFLTTQDAPVQGSVGARLVGRAIDRECRECGQQFTIDGAFSIAAQYVFVCPECSERHAEAQQREEVARAPKIRLARWRKLCPDDFWEIDPKKHKNWSAHLKAMEWRYGPKGLVQFGPTGHCKSRTAWHLCEREYLAGRSVMVTDSGTFFDYGELFEKGAKAAAAWVRECVEADILLADDLFKVKITESIESAIFTIFTQRTEHQRPIILTTQDVGKTLESRMSSDRGAALIRRLVDFCVQIPF